MIADKLYKPLLLWYSTVFLLFVYHYTLPPPDIFGFLWELISIYAQVQYQIHASICDPTLGLTNNTSWEIPHTKTCCAGRGRASEKGSRSVISPANKSPSTTIGTALAIKEARLILTQQIKFPFHPKFLSEPTPLLYPSTPYHIIPSPSVTR